MTLRDQIINILYEPMLTDKSRHYACIKADTILTLLPSLPDWEKVLEWSTPIESSMGKGDVRTPLEFEDVDWEPILSDYVSMVEKGGEIVITKSGERIVRRGMRR